MIRSNDYKDKLDKAGTLYQQTIDKYTQDRQKMTMLEEQFKAGQIDKDVFNQ
jgi:hypothetical protein